MANLINLEAVYKVYGRAVKTTVLDDIHLAFGRGEYTAIIGQSGSGKSTLLNMIGVLDRPTSGKVQVDGKDTTVLSDDELAELRNQTIGFVFQFHYLLPEFTALENVLMPIWLGVGKPSAKLLERAEVLLETVGVGKYKNNRATDLSGGQQQRVAIARALINRPRIILADEPTGNLDSVSSGEVNKLLRKINREWETTMIIVTHDDRIARDCDRIIEIEDGRIKADYCTDNGEGKEAALAKSCKPSWPGNE